jgi:hypothetical protein
MQAKPEVCAWMNFVLRTSYSSTLTCAPGTCSSYIVTMPESTCRPGFDYTRAVAFHTPPAASCHCGPQSHVYEPSLTEGLTCPVCRPGQARTLWSGQGDNATRPCGLLSVSVECSRRRSAKLYTRTLCSRATTILSLLSLTARTYTNS